MLTATEQKPTMHGMNAAALNRAPAAMTFLQPMLAGGTGQSRSGQGSNEQVEC
jgi:hypothetical protein